jgi:hypothetical protein
VFEVVGFQIGDLYKVLVFFGWFRMSLCCSGLVVAAAVHCLIGMAGFWLIVDLLRVVFV